MICNNCASVGVLNQALNKEFFYCRTCKKEILPKENILVEGPNIITILKWTVGVHFSVHGRKPDELVISEENFSQFIQVCNESEYTDFQFKSDGHPYYKDIRILKESA